MNELYPLLPQHCLAGGGGFHRRGVGGDRRGAFTLIEIMVVVAILGIVLAMGMPSMVQTMKREPLLQAVFDLEGAMTLARQQAILRGEPWRFVIQVQKGSGDLEYFVAPAAAPRETLDPMGADAGENAVSGAILQAVLHPEVQVALLELNFSDQMDYEELNVRFYPNATCDDFTVVLEVGAKQAIITLDPVTSRPMTEIGS